MIKLRYINAEVRALLKTRTAVFRPGDAWKPTGEERTDFRRWERVARKSTSVSPTISPGVCNEQ